MKKTICFLFVLLVFFCSSIFAFAEPSVPNDGDVTFTASGQMVEKYFGLDQLYEALEPGDTAPYTVYIHNQHAKATRWYMSNKVLNSLEESEKDGRLYSRVSGGAYKYRLEYWGPGSREAVVLYDSDNKGIGYVGGEGNSTDPVGLHEATSNLEDYFFLDTLNSGESGTVILTVSLEGETQGNYYQNTAAEIQMNFAVELKDAGGKTAVKTGDENNLTPYYIGMVVAGLLFLYLALDALTDRMYKKGRG